MDYGTAKNLLTSPRIWYYVQELAIDYATAT